jgi:1-acyl-sn-glycerol-3-phosphate acyltransferase
MIKKIITIIISIIGLLSVSQTITLSSNFLNNKYMGASISKDIVFILASYVYKYGFDSNIYYKGDYNISNKVDILISNHINTFDFCNYLSLIKKFDYRPIYFIFRKDIVFFPGIGFMFNTDKDIKMNRNFDDDIDNINKYINEINEGIIIIMPEGTRFTPEKLKLAQEYSKNNNLPIFKNILFPKMKGLYTILYILKKNNKLGNIIDITLEVENLKHKKAHIDTLLTTDFGDTFNIINTYSVPTNILNNYNDFKNWFINTIWIKKDLLLENIQDKNIHNYIEYDYKIKHYEYLILIICISLFLYMVYYTNGLFIPYSLLISYFITFKDYQNMISS